MKLQITIDGKAYEVDVEVLEEDEDVELAGYALHRAAPGTAIGAHAHSYGGLWDADGKACHSPLMGLVIKVNAKPGQTIAADELLMVLEAMKMETNVTAPRAGTVKSVRVAQGDSVKMNQLLIELD